MIRDKKSIKKAELLSLLYKNVYLCKLYFIRMRDSYQMWFI